MLPRDRRPVWPAREARRPSLTAAEDRARQIREGAMARLETNSFETTDLAAAGSAPDALFELGLMYGAGRDVEIDLVSAHKWFNLAAMRGNDEAKRYRMEIAREMSREEIAEAQRQAREWLSRH
jgi:hypothetical protein